MLRLSSFIAFAVLLWNNVPARAAGHTEVRFSGALVQKNSNEEAVLRQFDVLLLQSEQTAFFHVFDHPRDGCPWPESFGQFGAANAPSPHLRYRYDGSQYNIDLPPLLLQIPDAQIGARWSVGTWSYEITGSDSVAGQSAWKIEARERRGRRRSLTVSEKNERTLKSSQEVFMGQGQRFELTMNLTRQVSVSPEAADQLNQLQSELLTLQAALKRRPDSQQTELSNRQVEIAAARVDGLTQLARNTPLQETVLSIRRDIERQQKRVAEAMGHRDKLLQQPAPTFSLNLITEGQTLTSESLAGRTVVLHFWKYSDKPLAEPYGQVGYLEFLYNKRKANGVEVVGIAMNQTLQSADTNRSGRRAARKLIEFMNLSYPVGYDNGSLIRALGDPRDSGGELPLWIVISPAGKIVHYSAGAYEVDRRAGLKELDDVLIQQIRAAAE